MITGSTVVLILAAFVDGELSRFPPRSVARTMRTYLCDTAGQLEAQHSLATMPGAVIQLDADFKHYRSLYETWDLLDDVYCFAGCATWSGRQHAFGSLASLRKALGERDYLGGFMPRPQWARGDAP